MTQNKAKKDSNFLDTQITELETKTENQNNHSSIDPPDNTSPSNKIKLIDRLLLTNFVNVSSEDKEAIYDPINDRYFKVRDFLGLKIPSDNSKILRDNKTIIDLLKLLQPLADASISYEYRSIKGDIEAHIEAQSSINDSIFRQQLGLKIILKSAYLIVKLARLVNEFLIKPELTLSEFRKLIETTYDNDKLTLVKTIELEDIKDNLKGLSEVFPELKLPSFDLKIIEPKLFTDSSITKTSSSLVADSMFKFCIGKNLNLFEISAKLSKVTSKYKTGSIELLFEQVENALIQDNYGEDTFKIFTALVAHWYQNKDKFNTIKVSGSDILNYLNKLYQKKDKNTKRIKKIFNLQWLATHCKLLKRIDVYSTGISPKNGNGFELKENPLIYFKEISYSPCQLDIYGDYDLSNITDLTIEYRMGDWFNYFDNDRYCTQFTYIHQKALSSSGMLSNFLTGISILTKQNQKGNFTVRYLLESMGYKKEIEEILTNKGSGSKANNFFISFNNMIREAQLIEDLHYNIEFSIPPEWQKRKPHGWFSQFLNLTLTIKDKEYLKTIEVKKEVIPPEPNPEKIKTIDDLKYVMDKFQISIRDLVKKSENKYTYYKIQKNLKTDKKEDITLKDNEIRELITYCYRINHSRKK
jgi:hypothetical protein